MATDFFERQDTARRHTTRLVFLFAVALVALVVSVDLLVAVTLGFLTRDESGQAIDLALAFDPVILALATLGTLLVVGGGSALKVAQLWGGGRVVAEQLGGRRLNPDSTEPSERQLLNVVEEMAIASGTPTPPLYLLDDEEGINAFAAGFGQDDAVVAVTRGTAERLDRNELQGVIAHEFSHILNGDMRLNIRLMGLLHGILIIGLIGHFVFRLALYSGLGRRRSKDNSQLPFLALGAGLMVIGFFGSFFGSMIKAAVSREREFLADASAVQFTRDPSGISGALKKIGGASTRATIKHPSAPEASHMFFGRATSGMTSLFATHPALGDRILRLDPSWDGVFVETGPAGPSASGGMAGMAGFASTGTPDLTRAVADIGQPSQAHLDYARTLVEHLPEALVAAAHDAYSARALVYAMLLDRHPEIRQRQLDHLSKHADAGVLTETEKLILPVTRLDPRARLPLLEMSMPALDMLNQRQYEPFKANIGVLIAADEKLGLFEWSLQRILIRQLDAQHLGASPTPMRQRTLRAAGPDCAVALSMLAWVGHSSETDAARAFDVGWSVLGLRTTGIQPAEACGYDRLDASLDALDEVGPLGKRKLLQAAAACVAFDRQVTVNEVELLRAVASSLSCPMPPLVGG